MIAKSFHELGHSRPLIRFKTGTIRTEYLASKWAIKAMPLFGFIPNAITFQFLEDCLRTYLPK